MSGFNITLPLGAVAASAIVFLRVPEQTPKQDVLAAFRNVPSNLDLIGFVLFAPSVLQLLLALQYGSYYYPWRSSRVIGLFCGSAANLVVWLCWNWHLKERALVPLSMVRQTIVWTAGLYHAGIYAALFGITYYLPIYFQAIHDATPLRSGVYLLPMVLAQLFSVGLSGPLRTSDIAAKMDVVSMLTLISAKDRVRDTVGHCSHSTSFSR